MKLENIEVFDLVEASDRSLAKDQVLSDLERKIKNINKLDYLSQVRVNFNLTCSVILLTKLKENDVLDFKISDASIDLDFNTKQQCVESVDCRVANIIDSLKEQYNNICNIEPLDDGEEVDLSTRKQTSYLRLLYSIPLGIELTIKVETNYLKLINFYKEFNSSDLPEVKEFCSNFNKFPYLDYFTKEYV